MTANPPTHRMSDDKDSLNCGPQWAPLSGGFCCSAGAGVESVVAVDFRNRMTDGVLKQQC